MRVILIVDDSPSVLHMLSAVLTTKDFKVLEASSGYEAMQMLDGRRVDIVITDLLMPVMNGVELTREIRSRYGYKDIPIVMLTTQSNEEMQKEGKAAGATCWIVKPFLPQELAVLVNTLIGSE